jgi:superkiller protein 3
LLGNFQQAVEAYQKAVELEPGLTPAWANLGRACAELGDYQQAADALQKAVELEPGLAPAWANLGRAYGELGNHERAIEVYRKVLSLTDDPDLTRLAQDGLKSLGSGV